MHNYIQASQRYRYCRREGHQSCTLISFFPLTSGNLVCSQGILMPRIPAKCSRRIPMRRARPPRTPGVSRTCLSGSEPVSASILARRLDLENPWGLSSCLPARISGQRPSIVNLQPIPFVPHPTAFVPQTTNVEKPPITHNIPRNQSSKSQESCLFLEKRFKKFL